LGGESRKHAIKGKKPKRQAATEPQKRGSLHSQGKLANSAIRPLFQGQRFALNAIVQRNNQFVGHLFSKPKKLGKY
jgi:hypothetical protein